MKAIQFFQYGSPDVLELNDIPKPVPSDNQVLIKVHAAAANPLDWHIMRGAPVIARFSFGLFKPKSSALGADVAGVIEAIGAEVKNFQVGDAVFGEIALSGRDSGGFAEYACVREELLVHKPDNVSFEEAASTPVVGFTAIQGMRDTGHIQAGQKVLINGASGGIGTFAVQLAKSYGTEVTGVCSTRNLDMVRSIGADHVIDYTREDFTNKQYDLVFDTVGNRSVWDYARALTSDGRCSIAGFTTMPWMFQVMLLNGFATRGTDKFIGMMDTAHANQDDLLMIKDLLEKGTIKPVIDRCYPLEETAEAIRYLETSRARGKVIVTLAQ